ncbi:hypothetical protein ACLB1G_14875 [Oxalobacteraceae bacterium A2-2]
MKTLLLLAAALLPTMAQAGWVDANGKPLPDTDSMRSLGDFGVQLVLTADERQFRRSWAGRELPVLPRLPVTQSVARGANLTGLILFHGCKAGPLGACDLVAELAIEGPDGSRTPVGASNVWSASPPAGGASQLGSDSVGMGIDPADPLGAYRLVALVRDRVANTSLTVAARFVVTDAAAPAKTDDAN